MEETEYWLELLGESGFFPKDGLAAVRKETVELKGIFVSIVIKHQSKVQTSKVLNSFIPIYPSSFRPYPFEEPIPHPLSLRIRLSDRHISLNYGNFF